MNCGVGGHFPTPPSRLTNKSLENNFLVMLRMIVGVRSTVRTDIVLAECRIPPLINLQCNAKRMVTFWNSRGTAAKAHAYLISSGLVQLWSHVTTHGPSSVRGRIISRRRKAESKWRNWQNCLAMAFFLTTAELFFTYSGYQNSNSLMN